jgi:predicted amidohydrolase YtcJ
VFLLPAAAQQPHADAIFFHGDILTGAHLRESDAAKTPARVTAIAMEQGKVVAVGSDADILKLKTSSTQTIDLHGAFAMPGFNDAHTHMANAGKKKLAVDLDGVNTLAEAQGRIKTYAATLKPRLWIQGGGWDHTRWPDKKLPSKADLDAVTGDHPCVLFRVDEHIVVANSAALAMAGITSTTKDPVGGKIDRDGQGNPTGIVRERPAYSLILAKVPAPSMEERRKAMEVAIQDALSHGVTSVQDLSDWEDFLALEELEHTHKLKLRVSEWMDFSLPLPVLEQRRASHSSDDELLHLGFLKAYMDGSLGSRTAAMEDPYADDPSNSGLPRYDQDKLNQMSVERARAGFQLGFHAIGDRANEMALDAFAAAEQVGIPANHPAPPAHPDAAIVTTNSKDFTPADLRLRVEHAQVLEPLDFDRYAKLGVIASVQPSHLLTDMNWAGARLGPERSKYAYAWKSFLDHGVTLAFGTDYPVEAINPFRGLYAAITRKNEAGTAVFEPQERISLNEALYAYTQAAAFAEFREKIRGRLEPGFLGDMVVLDRDITKASPEDLLHTKVLRTVVGGETVYQAGPGK